MRHFAALLLAGGALAATAPSSAPAPALSGAVNLLEPPLQNVLSRSGAYELIFNQNNRLRSAHGAFLMPEGRQDEIPIPIIIVGVIAKIILIVLFATGVLGGQAPTTASSVATGALNSPISDGSSLGVMVTDFVNNNPNLIQEFTTSILPALTPLVTVGDDASFNYDALLEKTEATAIARFDDLGGELYMAQIQSSEDGPAHSATLLSGGLEGLSPDATYTLSLHRSGDVSGDCHAVGDQFSSVTHNFKTDNKGRIVLLMRETDISLRGDHGIMGRSVVLSEHGTKRRSCGVVMNA